MKNKIANLRWMKHILVYKTQKSKFTYYIWHEAFCKLVINTLTKENDETEVMRQEKNEKGQTVYLIMRLEKKKKDRTLLGNAFKTALNSTLSIIEHSSKINRSQLNLFSASSWSMDQTVPSS